MPWINSDGLRVYFSGESRQIAGGEFPSAGTIRVIEWEVDANTISVAPATPTVLFPGFVIIPRNSVLDSVELQAETAVAGGTATSLTTGIQRIDGVTEYDYDGITTTAFLKTTLAANGQKNVITAGTTGAGALIGNETAYPGHLTVAWNGGTVPTSGRILVRLRIYVKDEDLLVNNW